VPSKKSAKTWNVSLRSRGLIVVSLPVAALLISGLLVAAMERSKERADLRIRQAIDFRAQLQNLYIVLIDAESATRNFALSGHENGLQPFGIVGPSIDAVLDKIRDLVKDDAEQVKRLSELRQMAHQRVASLEQLRDYYDAHKTDHAPPPGDLLAKARVSPDVLLVVSALGTAQSKLVQDQVMADLAHQATFRVAIAVCIVLGLVGGFLAVLKFTTNVVRRVRQLESGASQLESGLMPALIQDGDDELGRLAKAMEKAGAILASRDRELRLALENAQLLIWELNLETRHIRYHAGAASDDTILPVELLAPTVDGWISAVHPDDRDSVRGELAGVLHEGAVLNIEYRVVIRGGEARWMMVRAQRYAAGNGNPERLLGILGDVTDRRNAALEIERQAQELAGSKEALERQTGMLQSILDSMGDGVVVADTEGAFLVFNPAAQHVLGRRGFGSAEGWAEAYGLYLPDGVTIYPNDQVPFVRAIRGESVDAAELFVRRPGTTEGSWISVTARPLRRPDATIAGGIMVLRDITPAKRTAAALELAKQDAETANQAKSEFLSRMSHELRTPLNSILGFAQLLELASLTDKDRDNVEHILKGGYHLLDLINEILDLSRIEAGRLSISSEPVSMRDALKDAIELVRPLAAEANINLGSEVPIRCHRHVLADRQRLKQVLLNLLSNAIKFNRPGGSVMLSCGVAPGNRLRIEIADSGFGISPDGLGRIFRPFERLNADQTEIGGTGLGLALAKRLIEAMGGSIGVESAVGLGSKFSIELTLVDDPARQLDDDPAIAEMARDAADSRRGTVLYIEDNVSNLQLIERVLEHCEGVRLITAMQGQLGLDLAQTHKPDWILLDLHLPDISGEQVLKQLRQNPGTREIPVTVLSADATKAQISRLLFAGARDYLTKPLDVRQLLQLLEQTLRPDQDQNLEMARADRDHSE
jgi:PAS domain S-box-containing protein